MNENRCRVSRWRCSRTLHIQRFTQQRPTLTRSTHMCETELGHKRVFNPQCPQVLRSSLSHEAYAVFSLRFG